MHACWKRSEPQLCSRCSLKRMPCRALRKMLASVALRTSIGSRRMSCVFQQVKAVEERPTSPAMRDERTLTRSQLADQMRDALLADRADEQYAAAAKERADRMASS